MKKDINDVTDDISMIMREVVEAAESNMLAEIAASLNTDVSKLKTPRDYLLAQAGQNKALSNKLVVLARQSEQQQINIAKNIGVYAGINTAPLEDEIKRGSKILLVSAQNEKNTQVKKIYQLNKFNTSATFIPDLKASIIKQTELGIENGLPVTFKNGRKVGYREYMEMAVRTGIQQEIGQQQLEIAKQASIVFFLCDEFADCADDHADFQGKIYYNADYETMSLTEDAKQIIANAIKAKQLLSVQEVREGEPFLTTRPNCRHRFIPISIDEGIGEDISRVKTSVDSVRGNYRPENYDALKQQRALERNIRKNKKALETFELLKTRTNSADYDALIRKKRLAINNTQANLRTLLQRNPNLSRERRRETRKILVKDLGVKYNLNKGGTGQAPIPVTQEAPPPVVTAVEQVKLDETVAKHYAMPEEKQVYVKQRYDVAWQDKPNFFDKRIGTRNYSETFDLWEQELQARDLDYQDEQQFGVRKKVSYMYKSLQKHFPNLKIKFGEGVYSKVTNTLEFRNIADDSGENKFRTIEIITHELGHAFDSNIARKLGLADTSISLGRKSVEEFVRQVKGKRNISDFSKNVFIQNRILKPFEEKIAKLDVEQRAIFEAGDVFAKSVQAGISGIGSSTKILETSAFKLVEAFDKEDRGLQEAVKEKYNLGTLSRANTALGVYVNGQGLLQRKDSVFGFIKDDYEIYAKQLGFDPTEIKSNEEIQSMRQTYIARKEEIANIQKLVDAEIKVVSNDFIKNNIHKTQVSDFLDALSLGVLQDKKLVTYGHGKTYYGKNTGQSQIEIFTHLQTLNMLNPNTYLELKKEFPEICTAFEKVIDLSVDYIMNTEGVAGQ